MPVYSSMVVFVHGFRLVRMVVVFAITTHQAIMEGCWAERPADRPTFKSLDDQMQARAPRPARGGRKSPRREVSPRRDSPRKCKSPRRDLRGG